MAIKDGAPIKMEFEGIEIILTPDDAGYARAKAQIEAKQDLMFADARAKLGDRLKAIVKDELQLMTMAWDELDKEGKADPNTEPRLVLAGFALGVWFDGSLKGWGKTEFVAHNLLELRQRAKRSDAGEPKPVTK